MSLGIDVQNGKVLDPTDGVVKVWDPVDSTVKVFCNGEPIDLARISGEGDLDSAIHAMNIILAEPKSLPKKSYHLGNPRPPLFFSRDSLQNYLEKKRNDLVRLREQRNQAKTPKEIKKIQGIVTERLRNKRFMDALRVV